MISASSQCEEIDTKYKNTKANIKINAKMNKKTGL